MNPTTQAPTQGPTQGPTSGPTPGPTSGPTQGPTSGPTQGPTYYADQAFQLNNLQNCGVDRQKAYETVMSMPLKYREVVYSLMKTFNC